MIHRTIINDVRFDINLAIGEDSLFNIEGWKTPELIFEQTHIIAARRGSHSQDDIYKHIIYLKERFKKCEISLLDCPIYNMSSNFIRNKRKKEESIRYYVPKSVEHYIKKENLYTGGEVHGFI